MNLGRFQLGGFVPVSVSCRAADRPYAPVAAPTFRVYDDGGLLVTTGKIPPADVGAALGLFIFNLRLDEDFGVGVHSVAIQFTANGSPRLAVQHFEIVGGGDTDGAVISAYFYERPHARFLVEKLDSGQRLLGRNPRIS